MKEDWLKIYSHTYTQTKVKTKRKFKGKSLKCNTPKTKKKNDKAWLSKSTRRINLFDMAKI